MATLEIPRRYWSTFLQSFSRKHTGWLVRLETCRSSHAGADVQVRDVALAGITLEPKSPDEDEIAIVLSGAGGLTHWVDRPKAIELEENEWQADQVLAIRSDDGSHTVLRFGATALPERVNGMAK